MRGNGAGRPAIGEAAARLALGQNKGGLKVLSDANPAQDGPDQGVVIQMVRQALGPRLDALQQATTVAKESQRLLELANWAGDEAAARALTDSLRGLECALRVEP